MKINHAGYTVLFAGLLIMFLNGCSKSEEGTIPWVSNKNILFNPDLTYGTITDIDGNVYKTIQIGTQTWMAENLTTLKYKDGTVIPLVMDKTSWGNLTTSAYCWYKNDSATYKANYGALYNWYAVNTGKLCPTGWHVPSGAEWTTLINYLGGETPYYRDDLVAILIDYLGGGPYSLGSNTYILCGDTVVIVTDYLGGETYYVSDDTIVIVTDYLSGETPYLGDNTVAGGELKETGTTHWLSPNIGATNGSGFTALPGGSRSSGGSWDRDSIDGRWWSSTEDNSYSNEYAWYRHVSYDDGWAGESCPGEKVSGFSVRCIKD